MSTSRTPTLHPTPTDWLPAVEALVREAGALVMAVYAGDFAVRGKADASPVTLADEQAEALITARLLALAPGVPVVAEEAVSAGRCAALADPMAPFWLVDPLDGTREFVARNGEFTVNVGLVVGGVPVLGVVLAPACGGPGGRLFSGLVGAVGTGADSGAGGAAGAAGAGAWEDSGGHRREIHCRPPPPEGLTLLTSRSHGDAAELAAWLAAQPALRTVARQQGMGSSLKLALLAAGEADLVPRLGPTMEWDTAAAHALLRAAGGGLWQADGQPLAYAKPGWRNPGFVAAGLGTWPRRSV